MENGLSIQIFDQIPDLPKHQLKWRECEVTGALHVTIMNLKIEVMVKETVATTQEMHTLTGWVRMPMTNWLPLGDGFASLNEIKQDALQIAARQLRALAHHVASLANFEQI